MNYLIVETKCGGPGLVLPDGVGKHSITRTMDNTDNSASPCEMYQRAYLQLQRYHHDVLIYTHDDVTIHDPNWLARVLHLFEQPNTVAVGLGGAAFLGSPHLYKRPYNIWDMARSWYFSNQTDWEVHGAHEEGDRQVAVLDAFFMAVRTSFLDECGGWPTKHLTHHCLDLWLGCEAARRGKDIWITGASCTHHGGGTSIKDTYKQAKWLQGGTLESDHALPHKWLYEEYRDVLPIRSLRVPS